MSKDSLTITDERNGKTYESAIDLGTVRAMDLRKIKNSPDDFGLDDLRSRIHEHGFLQEQHHLYRRRQGHPSLSRLRHRGAGRALHVSPGGIPAALWRAAECAAGEGLDLGDHAPHDAARDHQALHRWLPLRCPSDGHPGEHAGGAFDGLSRGQGHRTTPKIGRSRSCA